MNFENQEVESIALLKENFGYKLLLDRLQAEIDNVKDDILDISQVVDKEQVIYLRALSSIYKIMKYLPEEMDKEFKNIKDNFKESPQENIPREYLEYLKNEYFKRKSPQGV